jgi:hypothetical protein
LRERRANGVGNGAVEHVEGQIKIDQRFAAPDGIVDGTDEVVEAEAVTNKRTVDFERQQFACSDRREKMQGESVEFGTEKSCLKGCCQ